MYAHTLEVNENFVDKQPVFDTGFGIALVTPPIDENYWACRVPLYKDQAVVAFPKFGTYGIGFQKEEDWNTNLPYTSKAEDICEHIWENVKYPNQISKEMLIQAIKMLQKYCENIN